MPANFFLMTRVRMALASAVVMLTAASCSQEANPSAAVSADKGTAADQPAVELVSGMELYASNCAACHGETPDLSSYYEGSLEDVQAIVKEGRGDMPAFSLSDEEIERIYEFIHATLDDASH